jgi:alanine-synthesizing transaminase
VWAHAFGGGNFGRLPHFWLSADINVRGTAWRVVLGKPRAACSSQRNLPILLAKPGQACHSSCLYSYSRRLSWSFSLNPFIQAVEAKRRTGVRLIDLTVSNPTEALADYPHSAIAHAYSQIRDYTYQPNPLGHASARLAIADWYQQRRCKISPSQIALTASTSEAYALLFKLFCNPGGEVLVPVPSYPLFEYLASLESVRIVPYRLLYDGNWFIDFENLGERISERARVIVVVNPNNPTGSFLKRWEAEKLIELARQHAIPIISDEVFMDYSFGNISDRFATFAGTDSILSFSLNGLSKSAAMPQMKLGWIAINGPKGEQDIARERLELILDTYLSVSTPVQYALPLLLEIGAGLKAKLSQRAGRNLTALAHILEHSPAHALHAEGGWSAVIQLPNTKPEEVWISRLLTEHSVVVQPGYFFDMPSEAYVVVSLITPEREFAEGITGLRHLASLG